jgi:carbamate kinase
MNSRAVIALGGNAFVTPGQALTMSQQFRVAGSALARLEPLFRQEMQLVITHGNGPQVGYMLMRVEEALGKAYSIPLEVCVAESEGELGYVLQQCLYNVLADAGIRRPIVSLLTQVVVDGNDPAFVHPTKPIGPFYDAARAQELSHAGFVVREDAGRGFRRVVPSPSPIEIVGIGIIERLLEQSAIVIAAGGGGIPVVKQDGHLRGVEAVVDKDSVAALLGEALDAQLLLILTGVPCAYLNFGTSREEPIGRIDPDMLKGYLRQGHFAPGSMQPKIEAAIRFCRRPITRAIICDPDNVAAALDNRAGTIIENRPD